MIALLGTLIISLRLPIDDVPVSVILMFVRINILRLSMNRLFLL